MDMKQIRWPERGEPEADLIDVTRDQVITALDGDPASIAVHRVADTIRVSFGPSSDELLIVVVLVRVGDDSFMWRIRQAHRMSAAEIAWWREEIKK